MHFLPPTSNCDACTISYFPPLLTSYLSPYFLPSYVLLVQAVIDQALEGQSTDNFTFPLFKDNGERVEVT